MRIGIDATCWPNRRGYGRFARSLLTATLALDRANEYVFYIDDDSTEFPLPSGVQVVRIATSVPTVKAAGAQGRRSLNDMWAISRTISRSQLDLFFFPSVYSYVPLISPVPKLVTIHDVIAETFPDLIFPTRRAKMYWDLKVKLACAQARLILTVSEYSKGRVAEKLGIPLDRIRVIPEAGDPSFQPLTHVDSAAVRARWKLPSNSRLLVYVGGFGPHKNLEMLVEIFAELRKNPRFCDIHLLLVGDYQKDVFYSCYQGLVAHIKQLGVGDSVHFTGFVSDDHLTEVFCTADLVVLPSLCEGFGLPPVEAAACGTPSVVTTESPLVEILGEGTVGVPPNDREGWLKTIGYLLSNEERRRAMGASARAASARLSWQDSGRCLLAIFEEVFKARDKTH